VTGVTAREAFDELVRGGRGLDEVLAGAEAARIDDAGGLDALVRRTLEAHHGPVAQYRAGKRKVFAFLVGQVIKASGGRADAPRVNDLVRRALDEEP
jgi:aspartyl-tRNA(Asn)/glutamyl-tRNA(Gln) amidotransferase subunit B